MIGTMNYKDKYTITQCIIYFFSIVMLVSCGTVDLKPPTKDTQVIIEGDKIDQLVAAGQYAEAAELAQKRAQDSQSPQREEYRIRAAELNILAQNHLLASQSLSLINEQTLSFDLLPRKRIAEARIALHQEQFSEVLASLPATLIDRSPQHNQTILELRAQGLLGINDLYASLQTRVQLSQIQLSPDDHTRNQNEIWKLLALANNSQLAKWEETTQDTITLGWIRLARTKRATYSNVEQLSYALDQWRQEHPQHPASANLLTSILETYTNYYTVPNKIALLLPMTGRFSKIANVIHTGIQSAHQLQTSSEYSPEIVVYDTGDNPGNIVSIYNSAVAEGADFIIGPLNKDAVDILAKQAELSVPVLTLNYATDTNFVANNFFQFGLLPEDEASQTAERASLDNHYNAIIIAPRSEWGQRISNAFHERFIALGGTVLDSQFYAHNETDFSIPLQVALQLDESELRYRELRSVLGRNLEFEPHRRQDVDMIFLVATPRTARLLRPQINYYYANDLDVYSTSHIFSGIENITQDRDLDGVIYCDIPWLLESTPENELIREILILDAEEDFALLPRFAALGIDAYRLPSKLAELSALPYQRFNGLTGTLKIVDHNKIYRELNWAQFVNGKPQLLPQYIPQTSNN
jgi:outer membrane PBP1 activator LpoA protein